MRNSIKFLFILIVFFYSYELFSSPLVKGNMHIPKMDRIKSTSSVSNIYKVQGQLFETWLPWSNKWRNSDRLSYVYNPSQQLVSDEDRNWDTINTVWTNNSTDSFTYDNMNRLYIHLTDAWNTNSYMNAARIVDSFSGNIKTETVYGWGNINYSAEYRDIYYLDNMGNDTLDINQGWDGSSWTNSVKYQTKYSSTGKAITIFTSQWNNNNWALSDRELNYYDGNGNDTLYVHQTPDVTVGKWQYVFTQKSTNIYNGAGQLLQVMQNGSYDNIKWMPFAKYNYSYDGNGNDTQNIVQLWDSISTAWVNNGRYTMTYQVFTGINSDETSLYIKVYPNPSKGNVNFEYSLAEKGYTKISIYDLSGKEITIPFCGFEDFGHQIKSLDMQLLPGIYIYTIQCGNFVNHGKLITN